MKIEMAWIDYIILTTMILILLLIFILTGTDCKCSCPMLPVLNNNIIENVLTN